MELKIDNRDEVGFKFFTQAGGKYYVYNSVFKPIEVKIHSVLIIADRTKNAKPSLMTTSRGILGAAIAGTAGVLIAAATSMPKWDVDMDIHLEDGRVLEVNVQNESMVRQLFAHVPKIDPRAKHRTQRGV